MALTVLRRGLTKPAAFFSTLRMGLLGPTLSQEEVSGCEAILAAAKGWPVSWAAYALATAYHETAHSMQPVKEFGGDAYFRRMYDIEGNRPSVARALGNLQPGDGVKFAGRGYVQLTGRANYARAASELGEPLVETPDLAMRPDLAAKILRAGMSQGWFTARKLSNYLPAKGPATQPQFVAARKIINGLDRAGDIAAYAMQFQTALSIGGWK